jgi:hypothetical protein
MKRASRMQVLVMVSCTLALSQAGHLICCNAQAGPAIRPEGVVEFLRPDGAVAASLVVEIAETLEARSQGLMHRMLGDYMTGMLFLFETAQPQTFWMRNTPTSLDIIFIDERSQVLNIASHTTPMSDRLYASTGPAKFVVEARAGFADRFGIRPGYAMRWRRLR